MMDVKYFVLKPKGNDPYAKASRTAMLAHAEEINETNHNLFLDLVKWVRGEEENATNDPA